MMVCRMAFDLSRRPCCFLHMSTTHPEVSIEVTGCMPISKREMVEDARITGPGADTTILKELQRDSTVKEVEVLTSSHDSVYCRVRQPMCPIVRLHQELSIPPTLPLTIEKGIHNVLLTAPAGEIRRIFAYSKRKFRNVRIASIRRSALEGPESLLTKRQVEVFRAALTSGYWDAPRRVTLAELAGVLKISKSALGEIMSRIESKLLHAAADELT
jgi:predicted DNA binding protein